MVLGGWLGGLAGLRVAEALASVAFERLHRPELAGLLLTLLVAVPCLGATLVGVLLGGVIARRRHDSSGASSPEHLPRDEGSARGGQRRALLGLVGVIASGVAWAAWRLHALDLWVHIPPSILALAALSMGSAALGARRALRTPLVLRPAVLTAAAIGACAVAVLGGALSLPTYPTRAAGRAALDHHALLATAALRCGRWAWDVDGDGHAPVWGGGDCDDTDPGRNPGAEDTPNDGVDQDCLGGDALGRMTLTESLALPPPGASLGAVEGRRPRIVLLVVIDALRADATAAGGGQRSVTPRLDELAARGGAFTQARAAASATWPSVPALMTGRYPGGLRWARRGSPPALDGANTTLAERLSAAGFHTAAVVSNYLRYRLSSLGQGFRQFESVLPADASKEQRADTSPLFAARARRILQDHNDGKLFLYLHFIDPHHPYRVRAGFTRGSGARARYEGEIAYADHHVGAVLDALEELGLWRDTLVIITGDHGEEFGEHGGRFHGETLYDEGLRVPLVFAGAGLAPGRSGAPVSLVDVVPTVLQLVGIERPGPGTLHGRSLVADLHGQPPAEAPRRPVFAQTGPWKADSRVAVVAAGRIKVITDRRQRVFEQYDLAADPVEANDLFPGGGSSADRALARLQAFLVGLRPPPPQRE